MISAEKVIIRWNRLLRNLFFHLIFWISGFCFFVFLTGESQLFQPYFNLLDIKSIYFNAIIMGVCTAILFIFLDILFKIRIFSFLPVLILIIFKSFIYCASAFIIILVITKPLSNIVLIRNTDQLIYNLPIIDTSFLRFLSYFYLASFFNSFYKGMVRKMGRRNFHSWILGFLNKPREEKRIFMFIDMKSSTTIAEQLQHRKFSRLVRDVFNDLSIVDNYDGEIYQYLGDGAIISWKIKNGLKRNNVINAFYAFSGLIKKREKHYQRKYGLLPKVKAGIHVGEVIVMQVGQIKKDISYNGDTLNTAARIESQCNEYRQDLLISGNLYDLINDKNEFKFKNAGSIKLKGKKRAVEIYQVKQK